MAAAAAAVAASLVAAAAAASVAASAAAAAPHLDQCVLNVQPPHHLGKVVQLLQIVCGVGDKGAGIAAPLEEAAGQQLPSSSCAYKLATTPLHPTGSVRSLAVCPRTWGLMGRPRACARLTELLSSSTAASL